MQSPPRTWYGAVEWTLVAGLFIALVAPPTYGEEPRSAGCYEPIEPPVPCTPSTPGTVDPFFWLGVALVVAAVAMWLVIWKLRADIGDEPMPDPPASVPMKYD